MLDAFLATIVQLAGARAGTLQVPSFDGEPDFFASWERANVLGEQIRLPSTRVVLPLESGGRTLGLFTLHFDPPAVAQDDPAAPYKPGTAGAPAAKSAGRGSASGLLPETLTAREREILSHIASGRSNKTIARTLGISPDTVKLHVRHIMAKLGCRSRVAAAGLPLQHGLAHERA